MKKYQIELTQAQRQELNQIIKTRQAKSTEDPACAHLAKSDSGEQGPAWSYTRLSTPWSRRKHHCTGAQALCGT